MIQLRKQALQSVIATTSSSVEQESLSTFQAAVRRVNDSLEEDFGDLLSVTEAEQGSSEGHSDTPGDEEGCVGDKIVPYTLI
jgi:hypothetical protein